MTCSAEIPKQRILWILFFEFFKIATFVVGGGFAILLVADDVFVKKHKWLRSGELSDMLAIIQTVPGLTAGNVAIYTGYRKAGFQGALAALFGVALPSFIVITVIAMGFNFIPMDNRIVQGAFLGVRTAMTGLMIVALVSVWRGSVKSKVQFALFFIGVLVTVLFRINPAWLIGGALIFGPMYCMMMCRELPKACYDEKDTDK